MTRADTGTGAADPLPVVVGVDGSPAALRAAASAADEALRRGAPLLLVHAVPAAYETVPPARTGLAGTTAAQEEAAGTLLGRVSDAVADRLPADRIGRRIAQGDPAAVLYGLSAAAQLVVVGSRGLGGVAGLLIGSTASALAASARCPVVVVPDDGAVLVSRRRSVVVGVEGLGRDDDVLAFAVREAALRGTDLVAVHAWQDVVLDTALRTASPLVDWAGLAADEQRVLAEALAGWQAGEPDVGISEVVVRDRTVAALAAAGLTAELLVVGRTPHRLLGRLGSTAHGVLHRAGGPVAVVPVAGAPR